MTDKVTMYPTKVSQPNRNESSGMNKHCLYAVKRSGAVYSYKPACSDQGDPKYHHEWSNAEEITKGGPIQCGRKSTKMCSHATYHGIAGYRNTCPIAGITGTYTQPATLRLYFNLSKKDISSKAKIKKVTISFEHRCTGVDVSNGKESTSWGPNFSGHDKYPSIKPLTVKIGNQKKSSNKNPPLSSKYSGTGDFTFKNVSYKDLTSHGVDIIYGPNLETNPGNIYIKNLKAEIEYDDEDIVPYLKGEQDKTELYISNTQGCRTSILFTLEAGYKKGKEILPISKDTPNIRTNISWANSNFQTVLSTLDPNNEKRKIFKIYDTSNTEGEKTVTFYLSGTDESLTFDYNAILRKKPEISIPKEIEKNVITPGITSIIAKNGCVGTIKAFDNNTSNLIYTFNTFTNNQDNLITDTDITNFYKVLASLTCGPHIIYFQRDSENLNSLEEHPITILPTKYDFQITEPDTLNTPISEIELLQNKGNNHKLTITFIKTKDYVNNPVIQIINSTHGKEEQVNNKTIPTKNIIGEEDWTINLTETTSFSKELTIGTYYPGEYNIIIGDKDIKCNNEETQTKFTANIIPNHRQYFDEIFVRGEDSTAFNYDYLVAFEGDSITEPLYVEGVQLGTSYKDIKICTSKNNITGLTQINSFKMSISNTSDNLIKNLYIELNPLIKDEDDIYQVTSNEWLENDGIFYNFEENFNSYNKEYEDFVSIKNLSPDSDNIDEEDVYIYIKQLQPNSSITLNIPYGSHIEKEVWLQILLFGQPMNLFTLEDCGSKTSPFDIISLRVYDSAATDMKITGKTDLFEPDIKRKCEIGAEYYTTDLTYSIKNIDSIELNEQVTTSISNDPRLVPYKIKSKKDTVAKNIPESGVVSSNIIVNRNLNATRKTVIVGEKVTGSLKFPNYEEITFKGYTDNQGEIIFFIPLPSTIQGPYTVTQLLDYITLNYEGNYFYNGTTFNPETTQQTSLINLKKNTSTIDVFEDNSLKYRGAQTVPLKIKLYGYIKYIKNNIIFKPDISESGKSDEITVSYRICNLNNNEGILKTEFSTKIPNDDVYEEWDYHLVPNQVSKDIYCGIDTDTELRTRLVRLIVENKTINRLYISLLNKKRNNKEVIITIEELQNIERYDIIGYNVDKGTVSITENKVSWSIDYLEKDENINGYIDLRAEYVGFSHLKTQKSDFLSDKNYKFGEDTIECECRKKGV